MKQINNEEALRVLSYWTALEVLTYQSFRAPKDLVEFNNESLIISLKNGLPWEKGGEAPPRGKQIFYEIVLGTINAQKAIESLINIYGGLNEEFNIPLGEVIIATAIVNCKGHVIEINVTDDEGNIIKVNASSAISSFAWGLPMALKGDLKTLTSWNTEEKRVRVVLSTILLLKDEEGKDIPLNWQRINEAFDYLVETFDLPKDIVIDNKFGIKIYKSENKDVSEADNAPQPRLLNSFYLNDLLIAQGIIHKNVAPSNLHRYLGMVIPDERFNMLDNNFILEKKLSPAQMPRAKWPAPGRSPLSLLQQAAVNISTNELADDGILAINGPPGTGKTTLLRDIIAQVITARAKIMMEYKNPNDAFSDTGLTVKAGKGFWKTYKLDEKLKGFEILIASSNNKAVENVSAELPGIEAIAKDATDLRYFSCLSDKLLGIESWGLVSAILGNSSNRSNFCNKFWWDEDVSMAAYLQAASKRSRESVEREIMDESTGKMITKTPQIVEENNSPLSENEVKKNWEQACKNFKKAYEKSEEALSKLEDLRIILQELEEYENEENNSQTLENLIDEHNKSMPNFLHRFFKTQTAQAWQKYSSGLHRWSNIKEKAAFCIKTLQPHIINKELLEGCKKALHITSPWCDQEAQLLRDAVFIEAIKLHKAFIDMAATPLRHNLGTFMQGFATQKYDNEIKDIIPELWASFFLVVPSASTTFASIEKMLERLPQKSLGWLLIDEAGQAIPQAAIGAIMKTKRVIITGDPMQLEPIVTLPENLVKEICKRLKVNASRFSPPTASVQTLADITTPYFSELNGRYGTRTIGFPLLVHRRCADPMFSVANSIAYERLMVHAKTPKASAIRDCLGSSQWFDVQSKNLSADKWYECEGVKVIELLNKLKDANVSPDLYIISPFKIIANNIKRMIIRDSALRSWKEISDKWISERIGTIHTTQGREAEAIILILGAQGMGQKSSRAWAGRTPNLLNVAMTRAKEALYVVGHKENWKDIKYFSDLYERLEFHNKSSASPTE